MEQLTPQMLRERTRERLRSSFSAFAQAAWKQVAPKALEWNWHLELECEYLQLAYERQVLRLIVTVPPRTLKSRLISVLFACWCWAKDPSLSFLFTSYSDSLSDELSILRRSLLQSKWFQEMFPGQVQFAADQNQKAKYQNLRKGQMIATSMGAVALGVGADFLLIDDPLSPEQSYSDAERGNVNRAFDGTFRSRLNEAERGVIVIIAQRLHESDLIGHVLTNEPGVWTHINLPMIAETDEEIIFPLSGRVLRRKAGDLLFPQRFSKRWCEKQRATIGTYLWSSQYQQRPGVLGGAIFKSDWFREYTNLPESKPGMSVLSLDTAFSTKKSADYSVATAWTMYEGRFYLRYVWRDRCEYPKLKAMVQALCEDLRPEVVLVEEKGSGQSLLQSLKEETSLPVVGVTPDTDKVSRAHGVSALFESGRVFFPRDEPWMPTFRHELELFPSSAHDDQVDSMTQALTYLRSRGYDGGILGVIKWIEKKAKLGAEPYRAPGAAVLRGSGGQVVSVRDQPAKCPLCGGPRIWMSHGMDSSRLVAFCNQDGSKDGILPVTTDNSYCPHYEDGQHRMVPGGGAMHCTGCQYTPDVSAHQSYNGASFADLKRIRGRRVG